MSFNNDLLLFDDGTTVRASQLNPLSLRELGLQQVRRRRALLPPQDRGLEIFPDWDSYFGLLQAKEAAAAAQDRNFELDPASWGQSKALDVPTGRIYNLSAGEVPPGFRERPVAALANWSNLSTDQRGWYTPKEIDQAGGVNSLTEARRRALESLRSSTVKRIRSGLF